MPCNLQVGLFLLSLFWGSITFAQDLVTDSLPHHPYQVLARFSSEIGDSERFTIVHGEGDSVHSLLQSISIREIVPLCPESRNVSSEVALNQPVILVLELSGDLQETMAKIRGTGLFEYVEYDAFYAFDDAGCQSVPNDSLFSDQWNLVDNPDDTTCGESDIEMDLAWLIEEGDSGVIAAIVDSGINPNHPELTNRVWRNTGEIAGNFKDDDGNGFVDDVDGWNFYGNDEDIRDYTDHGTQIAGIVGAEGNNTTGYSGIDHHCQLMAVKVTDSKIIQWSALASAIYYAVNNGADVINLSLSGQTLSKSIQDACEYGYQRNVVIVASTGNNGDNIIRYPAGFSTTVAVGAINCRNQRASFGSYGSHMDVVAPGESVPVISNLKPNVYGTLVNGTSFSTPHVVGMATLLRALDSSLSVDSVRTLIRLGSRDSIGKKSEDVSGFDSYYGFGGVRASKTLLRAINGSAATTYQEITMEGCDSVVSPSGQHRWTNTGTYLDTLVGHIGCDTVIRIDVKIYSPWYTIDTISACDFYPRRASSEKWVSSGKYWDTVRTENRCDSIWEIDLTVNHSSADTIDLVGCADLKSPSGRYVFRETGQYRDTIQSVNGCDSVLLIHFVRRYPSDTTIRVVSCVPIYSPSGKINMFYSGSFKDVIPSSNGCDSVIRIEFELRKLENDISFQWPYLKTNAPEEASFQWLHCDTHDAIFGATDRLFKPQQNGGYAVEVKTNYCTDTSACFDLNTANMDVIQPEVLHVIPNPTIGEVVILSGFGPIRHAMMYTNLGQEVLSHVYRKDGETIIRFDGPAGVYFLVLELNDGQMVTKRLVKI